MGYTCPVCGDPQADEHHLANHLAFTAMLGDGSHAEWLDERAPGWAEADPADLAATVTDHAEETEYPQVFEDTTDEGPDEHDHQHDGHGQTHDYGDVDDPAGTLDGIAGDADPIGSVDDAGERDTDDVLAKARELTRRRRVNATRGDGYDETAEAEEDSTRDDQNDGNSSANGGTDDGEQ